MLKAITLCFGFLWNLSPCAGHDVEGSGKSGSAVFLSADYIELSVPLANRIAVNTCGLYFGSVRSSIALLEVPLSVQKHFTLTPSYLFIDLSPSGRSLLTGELVSVSYRENQFRLAATFVATTHHFICPDRNMYLRRFTPTGDVNRHRNRALLARSVSRASYKFTPFVFDEVYHHSLPGEWPFRNWVVVAVDMPPNRYLTLQPSYIRQDNQFLRTVNFLGIGVIIKTGKLFHHARPNSDKSHTDRLTVEAAVASAIEDPMFGQEWCLHRVSALSPRASRGIRGCCNVIRQVATNE